MTRAIDILMRFAKGCSEAEGGVISEDIRRAANEAMSAARSLRSENAIVYIGIDGGGPSKYFGTVEAARSWVKKEPGRHFKSEDLLF